MKKDLTFKYQGILEEEFINRTDSNITVLSGTNNSGKTLILKNLYTLTKSNSYFCGMARFYNIEYFERAKNIPDHADKIRREIKLIRDEDKLNRDYLTINFSDIFISMSDVERDKVLKTCADCLGESVELDHLIPGNSQSNTYLKVGGRPLSTSSTGTRMLIHLISVLYYEKFDYVFIDEPELGLTPKIQDAIQQLLFKGSNDIYGHLKHIYLATHSHIFLNRNRVSDNFAVSRFGKTINVKRLSTYQEFIDLQFSQLGNSFNQLQLPSGFIVVEGKTDYGYLKRLLQLKLPNHRANITIAGDDGQVKNKLNALLEVTGKLDTSPYNRRVLIVLDSKHSPTLPSELIKMGVNETDIIEWKMNGIEYYYPESILRNIYKDDALQAHNLNMTKDRISHNGIELTKVELCNKILEFLDGTEVLSDELVKFIGRVKEL